MQLRLPRIDALGALALGLVSQAGFAPLDWWPLTVLAFTGWMMLVHRAPTLRRALWLGWLFGVAHFTLGNAWIQQAFAYQDQMPPELGYGAVVLLALYLAVYPAMAAGLAWRWGRRAGLADTRFVLVFAAGWIASEWLRGQMFTGYVWNPLGTIWLGAGDAAGLAAWIGVHALSGVTILIAGAALLLVTRRDWRLAAASAAILATPFAARALTPPGTPAADAPLVRIVQPGIGQEQVGQPGYAARVFDRLLTLSGSATDRPDGRRRLLLWPEGTVNYYVEDGYPWQLYDGVPASVTRARIAARLAPGDLALVSGNALIFGPEENGFATIAGAGNSVFAIDSAGVMLGRYDKAHLVPYGEYLPMRSILEPLGLSRLVMGDIDFLPGPGPGNLALPGIGLAGMQVCYEIIFSAQVISPDARPLFLFNPSNDAWFGPTGPPQHLAQARMRAIEEGLPVLRSTPTGVSAIIDARGHLVASIGGGRAAAIEAPLPPPAPPTLFARTGHGMTLLIVLLLAGCAIAIGRRTR